MKQSIYQTPKRASVQPALLFQLVAITAAMVATYSVRAQNIVESTSSTSAWVGTPVFQTGAAPTTDSGGTTQDNDSWGGNANGANGFGALGQAFEVTTPGSLATIQMVMSGSPANFNVELYNLGVPPAGYQNAAGNAPGITQINTLGSAVTASSGSITPSTGATLNGGVNLLQAGDNFSFAGAGNNLQTLVTLTFGGEDANVPLLPGNLYLISLDPTANADGSWWVRGGIPVSTYNTGEGFNEDGVDGMQGFEGKTSVRDFDTGVTEGPLSVDVLGTFQGSSDPTDTGWSDWTSGLAITATAPGTDDQYSFVSAGVGNALSLQVTPVNPGNSQNLSLNLSSSQIAAFFTNSYLTFTFSAPAANSASAGYSQIANFIVNAPGWGFKAVPWSLATEAGNTGGNQSGEPVFDFYSAGSSTLQSQTVTINYSSILSQISANPGYLQFIFNTESGGGAPANFFINNVVLSSGPYGETAPPGPPKVKAQPVKPELRIIAGSPASIYDREEVDTSPDGDESWIGGNYPVSYSFTLLDYPVAPGMQCQIFLVPTATLPTSNNPTGNEYVDYQASNELSMLIAGGPANPNGSASYTASVLWKVNSSNSSPSIEALTGGAYSSTGNQSPVGTWTLTFNNATNGTLTPPGVAALSFTIADSSAATDFGGPAGPVMACFGLQPNAAANEGAYIDYASISITRTAHPISENFTTDYPANTSISSSGLWDTSDSAAPTSLQLVNPITTPLWVYWSLPDTGYGLGVTPLLPALPQYNGNQSGNLPGYVLPEQYNGYYNDPITISRAGGTNWTLIPYYCLPSYEYPNLTNAFFILQNPPPLN